MLKMLATSWESLECCLMKRMPRMLYSTRLLLPTSASTASTLISSEPTLASVATPWRERWQRDLGPGWLLLPHHPAGFSWRYLWCPPSPWHPLPAVYSDLVNWGDWSLMSSRKIRTS